jgi:hypothetical protein
MKTERKSFVIHIDSLDVLDDLNNEQKAQLLDAIRSYHLGDEIELTGLMRAIFKPFENQFKRDNEKYLSIVQRNKSNGSKGGRPKEQEPKEPTGFSGLPKEPKKADSDNDNDNDSVNDNKKEKKELQAFAPPSLEEFINYVLEHERRINHKIDITIAKSKFYAWEAGEWKDGNGKTIKNWKAKIAHNSKYWLESQSTRRENSHVSLLNASKQL